MIPHHLLLKVEKPGRYIGNEINMVKKNPKDMDCRFAFCFPDVYEVGMSHLGMEILYYFLNRRADTYCERVYAPWFDMENIMREHGYPLFTLETKSPLSDFDFVAFTLQYEMSFTNILNMLDLANIPLWANERDDSYPIIICGGTGAYNPEPIADFVDVFYLGEGEVLYDEIIEIYKDSKNKGESKHQFLERLLELDGLYIPKFYDVTYKENGEIKAVTPNHKNARKTIQKVIVNNLDEVFYPDTQLVPLIEVVHDRVTLEVFRGCIRGCRFCQAGFVYRPVREKSVNTLLRDAKHLVAKSGHEEISLTSLSTSDYSNFKSLAEGLVDNFSKDHVNLSLPSLRVDAFSLELTEKISSIRRTNLTFAPEAGTQRLRDVINKNLTEEEILGGLRLAFLGGYTKVKLYFMMGLPTETDKDLLGIATLSNKIVEEYYKEKRKRPVNVTISNSCFVPKPFTPFQWHSQDTAAEFLRKARLVKNAIKNKHISYNYHEVQLSVLEGVIARGDRRMSKALYNAFKLGVKFDAWSDYFNYEKWVQAFKEADLSMDFYTHRKREYSEILPWDHLSVGVSKEFLISECNKALAEETTPNCRDKCSDCGAMDFSGGVCFGL